MSILTNRPPMSWWEYFIPGRFRKREKEMVAAWVKTLFAEYGPPAPDAIVAAQMQLGSITAATIEVDDERFRAMLDEYVHIPDDK